MPKKLCRMFRQSAGSPAVRGLLGNQIQNRARFSRQGESANAAQKPPATNGRV